jgi:hypothetical protein
MVERAIEPSDGKKDGAEDREGKPGDGGMADDADIGGHA